MDTGNKWGAAHGFHGLPKLKWMSPVLVNRTGNLAASYWISVCLSFMVSINAVAMMSKGKNTYHLKFNSEIVIGFLLCQLILLQTKTIQRNYYYYLPLTNSLFPQAVININSKISIMISWFSVFSIASWLSCDVFWASIFVLIPRKKHQLNKKTN